MFWSYSPYQPVSFCLSPSSDCSSPSQGVCLIYYPLINYQIFFLMVEFIKKIFFEVCTLLYVFIYYVSLAALGFCCCTGFSLVVAGRVYCGCAAWVSHCSGFS